MATYSYYKAISRNPSGKPKVAKKSYHKIHQIIPNLLILLGATAVTAVVYPMISYQVLAMQWNKEQIASPVAGAEWDEIKNQATNTVINKSAAQPVIAYQAPDQPEIVSGIDYTKADTWFTKPIPINNTTSTEKKEISYTLSIPKLKIENMRVLYATDNLDKHLIQYPGTALPGEYGNPVIFGHSVLPLFNNPKNYRSVFTMLPTLKKGDAIIVDYDGVTYTYIVESYHEVNPDQIEVLEQQYDRQTLTLVTCVPPGTTLRRGVIQAVLENNNR